MKMRSAKAEDRGVFQRFYYGTQGKRRRTKRRRSTASSRGAYICLGKGFILPAGENYDSYTRQVLHGIEGPVNEMTGDYSQASGRGQMLLDTHGSGSKAGMGVVPEAAEGDTKGVRVASNADPNPRDPGDHSGLTSRQQQIRELG